MPPYVRILITLLIGQPGRLACLVGLAFSLLLGINLIYDVRPLATMHPTWLPACLGAAAIGFGMVMFAAVLKRSPDDSLTARQVAALAGLAQLMEALMELSVLLLVGTTLFYFNGYPTAALHLGIGLLAALSIYGGAYRLEKRLERDRNPEEAEPSKAV